GKLMKKQKGLKGIEEKVESIPELAKMGTGLFIATAFFVSGYLLSQFIPLHPYALMILCVGLVKALGVMPAHFEEGAALWGDFMVLILTPALLACIGIGFTNLHQVAEVLTLQYFILVLATVTGAILGTALIGRLLGFYPIEASITAGLCMANMGGTGDVAVLSAARRMNLMPFAQVSSRIGGALILLLATGLLGLL
ncbi:MAG: 2-hydroxycarboxylate transporter family protein, partial [Endozoicomonas sp.]